MERQTTGAGIGSWCFPRKQAGARHSRSPVLPWVRTGDGASMRRRELKRESIPPLAPIAPHQEAPTKAVLLRRKLLFDVGVHGGGEILALRTEGVTPIVENL